MNPPSQAIEEARRAGIDVDLLDVNLALSVGERWRQHDAALQLAVKLEQCGLLPAENLGPEMNLLTVKELRAIAARQK